MGCLMQAFCSWTHAHVVLWILSIISCGPVMRGSSVIDRSITAGDTVCIFVALGILASSIAPGRPTHTSALCSGNFLDNTKYNNKGANSCRKLLHRPSGKGA